MFFGFLRKKKTSIPSKERRRESRIEAEDDFILEFKERGSHYLGNGRDISVNGVRFVTTCKVHKHKRILLNFRLPQEFPGQKHFSVPATVVRVYKQLGMVRYRVGCSLQHESEATKEILRQYIFWLEHKA